jgi:ribosomal protein S27AE
MHGNKFATLTRSTVLSSMIAGLRQANQIKPRYSKMADSLKQERQTKKTEGSLNPDKQGKERAASDLTAEVEGHAVLIFVTCPHCGSSRVISFDYEGEWFTCGQCQGTYQVVS